MSDHPNDLLVALEWAVAQAEQSADPIVKLTTLASLRLMRDQAKREAGK